MKKVWLLLLLTACLTGWFCAQATTAPPRRVPKPDFDNGYKSPPLSTPAPRSDFREYADVILLAGALGLASWLSCTRRSRRGLVWLSAGSLAYFGFLRAGCVCPVGSIQNVALALTDPAYRPPIPVLAFFFLPLLFALWSGRTFCAGVCPLGALQDLLALRPIRVRPTLEAVLGLLPWVFLGLVTLFALTGAAFLACRYDPYVTLFRMGGDVFMVGLTLFFLLMGVFVARPYCRYLCPYGVLLGLVSRLAARRATITARTCQPCRLCEESCPVGAIRPPSPQPPPEPRRISARRLGLLLALLPLLMGLGGWSVSRLDGLLARMHPTVRLAGQIYDETRGVTRQTTVESRAFRVSRTSPAELYRQAGAIRDRFSTGAWILGAFLGLVVGARLIALGIHRRQPDYRPDPAHCLRCGRCYSFCPQDRPQPPEEPEASHDQTA